MRAREFLNEFSHAHDAFRWECIDGGAIRGVLKSGNGSTVFDPVTSVLSLRESDRNCEASDRVWAAGRLGLTARDRQAILNAVDGAVWTCVDGETVLDGYAAWIREAILDAAELDDEVAPRTFTEDIRATVSAGSAGRELELQHS